MKYQQNMVIMERPCWGKRYGRSCVILEFTTMSAM